MGVEPTGRRFPDIPLALKARRVTGPYSLPSGIIEHKGNMTTTYEVRKKRRVNRAKKKARLKRRAEAHYHQRTGKTEPPSLVSQAAPATEVAFGGGGRGGTGGRAGSGA